MNTSNGQQAHTHGTRLAATVIALGLMAGVVALMAGPGYRLGWWGLREGIKAISWSGMASAGLVVLSLLGAAIAYKMGLRPAFTRFLAGAALSALTALPVAYFGYKANTLPHIHDVTTDTVHPPAFVAVLPLRKDAKNPATYDPLVAPLQQQAYPDIAPIALPMDGTHAFVLTQQVAQAMGWEVVAVDATALRMEATATTRLFGFKDDIVVRVTPADKGSTVDIRSLSRVGGSDIGTNAARIRTFRQRLLDAAAAKG